jgi:PhoH-like ATPase
MADSDHAANLTQEDRRKIIIPDTNVSVNFSRALESSFDDNYVIVPEVSMDELDSFKREKDSGRGQSAREALRMFERLSEEGDLRKGVALANGGMLYVFPRIGEKDFLGMERTPDNEIIATALLFQKTNPNRSVVVVSDDKRLRVKARYYGLRAEPYSPKSPLNTSVLFEEEETIVLNDHQYQLLNEHDSVKLEGDYLSNHVYGVRSLAPSDSFEECFMRHDGLTLQRIHPEKLASLGVGSGNFRQKAACEALFDKNISLVCLLGMAGTIKTILSLAAGIQEVRNGAYDRIVVLRPPVPIGGKDKTGFIPGGIPEKMDPWMGPIADSLAYLFKVNVKKAASSPFKTIMSRSKGNHEIMVKMALEEFCISMASFDHLQGRTFADAYVIIDEAQNLPLEQARMVGTRAGENSKFVFDGDLSQTAVNPFSGRDSSGLALVAAAFVERPDASVIELRKVERSKLAEFFAKIGT